MSTKRNRTGKLVGGIIEILEAEQDNAFTTSDLAMRLYGVDWSEQEVTRPQRVAVQRAVKRVVELHPTEFMTCRGDGPWGQLIIFRLDNPQSYGMARMKEEQAHRYQRITAKFISTVTEADLRKTVDEGKATPVWSRQLRILNAEAQGDTALAEKLEAELAAYTTAAVEMIMGPLKSWSAPDTIFDTLLEVEVDTDIALTVASEFSEIRDNS